MKKKFIFISIIIFITIVLLYLQFGRQPKLTQSMTKSHASGYELSLVVTANQLYVFNQKKLEEKLLQQTLDNDFKEIYFSYDVLGKPDKITITVYANHLMKTLHHPTFQINYDVKTEQMY